MIFGKQDFCYWQEEEEKDVDRIDLTGDDDTKTNVSHKIHNLGDLAMVKDGAIYRLAYFDEEGAWQCVTSL